MKVAVLSESASDEAAIRVLADAVLRVRTGPATTAPLRSRGHAAVVNVLPTVIKQLHYRTDTEGLIVVIDSDDTRVHDPLRCAADPGDCRRCKLRELIQATRAGLRPVAGRGPLRTAVGLAVPAIESWLHEGVGRKVSEATWVRSLADGKRPYDRRQLKIDLYGSPRVAADRMVAAAETAARDLEKLRQWFPQGFGALYEDLRGW